MGEGGECICKGEEGRRVGGLWVMKAPSEAVTLPQTRGWCISSDSVCCRQVQYGRRRREAAQEEAGPVVCEVLLVAGVCGLIAGMLAQAIYFLVSLSRSRADGVAEPST